MKKYKPGDVVGECGVVTCRGEVFYSGGMEGTCSKCGQVYEVNFEQDESGSEVEIPPAAPEVEIPPQPELEAGPVERPNRKQPVGQESDAKDLTTGPPANKEDEFKLRFDFDQKQYEKLVSDIRENPDVLKRIFKLDSADIGTGLPPPELAIQPNIVNSSVWKYAQKFGKIGNPYRPMTQSYNIFEIFDEPLRPDQAVKVMIEKNLFNRMSALVNLYEVIIYCVSAGLLLYDTSTRKVSQCKTKPVPANTP